MNYSQQMLAQAEYARMINAVPSVPDYPNENGTVTRRSANWLRAIFTSVLSLIVR